MSDDTEIPPTTEPLDEAGGRALVEAWRVSGLSGAAFCRQHNLRAQRLHYWRERLGYPIKATAESPRVHGDRPPTTDGFVQVVVGPTLPTPTTHVDIVVGHALVRVRPGFDPALLRDVVRAVMPTA